MDNDAIKATARRLGTTESQVRSVLDVYAQEVISLNRHIRPPVPAQKAAKSRRKAGKVAGDTPGDPRAGIDGRGPDEGSGLSLRPVPVV